jgi:hypothetical protein
MKIFVDIDGIICNNTYGKYKEAEPIFENIKKINKKYDEGNEIILWTARGATTGIDWKKLTKDQMKKWNVKYHSLCFKKPEYDIIIDDKAVTIYDL